MFQISFALWFQSRIPMSLVVPESRYRTSAADEILGGEFTLGPKLPQMMVHVEIGVAHALGPRHLAERCVRSELAIRITEAVKKNAELLQVGCKLGRWRTTSVLVHLMPRLDSVRPMKREPKRHPLINRAFEEGGGLTYPLFPKCCPKGIA